ncbi:type II toxin-antitoxin system RelE/ParE family toxin [Terracidiphilus gabretensis]|uniref:type II toxin-antitoxin system RelE/ParE family toxin n=1 Tax=Terracidiphilus gabretensis TaxID=1577687 RepID=UPI00071B4350|nr:type II toxin-antitoxin system RelE/ParE family toxin [Terracidiphilus gabretensis]
MIEVREYIDQSGRNHYRTWLAAFDAGIRTRIDRAVFRLGQGNFSIVKPEGAGVSALGLDFGPGYRIYFGQDGSEIVVLLAGGTKRRQEDDILLAKQLWDEYKKRKKGAPNAPHA